MKNNKCQYCGKEDCEHHRYYYDMTEEMDYISDDVKLITAYNFFGYLNLCSKEYQESFYKNIQQLYGTQRLEHIPFEDRKELLEKIQLQLEAEKNV